MSIINITSDNFESEVLQADKPVLVDFWAEWCGPCKAIAPILEQVAEEYKDRLTLAKLDVEENQNIAMQYAVRSIADTFEKYPTTGTLLPAMGYGDQQRADLEETINNTPCDLVVIATPIDLARIVNIKHPTRRVRYELQELGNPTVAQVLADKFGSK